MDRFELVIEDKSDLTNIKAHCTCGELDFEGDWDELCDLWFRHEADPKYTHLYVTKFDHKGQSLLSRAAHQRIKELWPDKFGEPDE